MSQVKRTLVHDSKPVSQGAILSFNIPSFETIDDVILQFTNNGAPASLANIKSSIGKIVKVKITKAKTYTLEGEEVHE